MTTKEAAIDTIEQLIKDGHFEDAMVILRKMDKQHPEEFYFPWRLGHVLAYCLRRWSEAITFFEKAVSIEPHNTMAWGGLGIAYFELSRWRPAIIALEKWIAARERVGPLVLLARALRMEGRLAESEERCRRAIELDPTYEEAFSNLGIALREQNRIAEAIQAFESALDLNPADPVALCELRRTYQEPKTGNGPKKGDIAGSG